MRTLCIRTTLSLLLSSTPALAFRLEDPLRGATVGNLVSGELTAEGWRVTGRADRLWYALPRLVEGSIEFTVTNITHQNLDTADHEIFAMYEAAFFNEPIEYSPDLRNNHYKCLLRIYGQPLPERLGLQKLMWGMCPSGDPGHGECRCNSFFEEPFGGDGAWDGSPQRLRIQWGGGRTTYSRNGAEVLSIDWSDTGLTFGPQEVHFSLGTPRPDSIDSASMPIGAVFSDVVVEGVEGPLATCDGPAPPDGGVVRLDGGVQPGAGEVFPTDDAPVYVGEPDRIAPASPDLAAESAGADPQELAYLRFDLSAVRVARAVLRLHARDAGSSGGDAVSVHAVHDVNWSEGTLTWNNRPTYDGVPLGRTPAVEAGQWYEVDVGAPQGVVAYALVGGGDGAHFSSKEEAGGAFAPRLVVTVDDSPRLDAAVGPAPDAQPAGPGGGPGGNEGPGAGPGGGGEGGGGQGGPGGAVVADASPDTDASTTSATGEGGGCDCRAAGSGSASLPLLILFGLGGASLGATNRTRTRTRTR